MKRAPLGEVAAVFNGKTPARSDQRDAGHPVLKIKDVRETGEFSGSFESFVEPDFATRFRAKQIRVGDVLVLNAAHNADYVGSKQYKAEAQVDGALATGEWLLARSTNGCLLQSYLWHWFQAPHTRQKIKKLIRGIHLYPRDVAELEIPLPPPDEQRRIALILDKADAIRRKRRQALAEIDALLRATFLHMFGDPATNPKGFDVGPVKQVLSRDRAGTQSGPFGAALKKHEYVSEGIPVWGIENVENNNFNPNMRLFVTAEKFAELKRYDVRDGDVLISRAGTVGRMCIARPPVEKSILSTNLVRVSLDRRKMLPEYFVTLFTSFPDRLSRLRANKKDNAFSFLNPGTLKVLEVPQPGIDLQTEFAKRVSAIAKTKQLRLKAIEMGDELFGTLSQRAFRGEL